MKSIITHFLNILDGTFFTGILGGVLAGLITAGIISIHRSIKEKNLKKDLKQEILTFIKSYKEQLNSSADITLPTGQKVSTNQIHTEVSKEYIESLILLIHTKGSILSPSDRYKLIKLLSKRKKMLIFLESKTIPSSLSHENFLKDLEETFNKINL